MSMLTSGADFYRRVNAGQARYPAGETEAVERAGALIDKTVTELADSCGLYAPGAPRRAFITFATPEYQWGLTIWLRSLRKVTSKPIFVLVSRQMQVPADVDNVFVVEVPGLYAEQFEFERAEFQHVLTKLWIFSLTCFDRLVFVDVDCLFLKPVDDLFEGADFLVCPDYVETRATEDFNSGLLAFSPSQELRGLIFTEIARVASNDGGDQGALNTILRDRVTFIDPAYNLLRHYYYFGAAAAPPDARIIHYIVKKPWELHYRETPDGMLIELDDLWTSFLHPGEALALIADWRRSIFHISERARIENAGPKAMAPLYARIDALEARARQQRSLAARALWLGLAGLAGAAIAALALHFWK